MALTKKSETSPLLAEGRTRYSSLNDPVTIEDNDLNGNISVVVTPDSSSPKSAESDDDLLNRRLNGSPLMVVLVGLVEVSHSICVVLLNRYDVP